MSGTLNGKRILKTTSGNSGENLFYMAFFWRPLQAIIASRYNFASVQR